MKKVFAMAFAVSCMLAAAPCVAGPVSPAKQTAQEVKWTKSTDGKWMGANSLWYKLSSKKGEVSTSKDGETWTVSRDGMWQDKEGKFYKITKMKLMWSKDGASWAPQPEMKWQGHDGKWYKFDKDLNLWVA